VHAGALEAGADGDLTASLDHTGGGAEALRLELGVAHAMAIPLEILAALARLVVGRSVGLERPHHGGQIAGVEFDVALVRPLPPQLAGHAIHGFGHGAQVLLGMEAVHDLEGAGTVLVGQIPDPRGAVPQDHAPLGVVKAAARGLAGDAGGEVRGVVVGVPARGPFDGGRVAHRARVAHRRAVLIARLRAPDRAELDLAGLGRAVGLLADAPGELRGPHGDAGPVHPQVEGRGDRGGGHRRDDAALVLGDLAAERLGGPLDVLGRHLDPRELPQQLAALLEADQRPHDADQASDGGRQRGALQAQRVVARADARVAGRTVVVGALQGQGAQHRDEALGPAAGVPGQLTARARPGGTRMVGRVGVEALRDDAGGQAQGVAADGDLHRLEIERVGHAGPYERLDLLDDLRLEGRAEPPFSAASCAAPPGVASWASAQRSHASQ